MSIRHRARALAALTVGLGMALIVGKAAHAVPMTYGLDVELLLDNGFGVAPGLYADAGSVVIDVPDAAPGGFSGATLLALEVTLGSDTWTLADAASPAPGGTPEFAGVLLDGAPVGLVYFGLNGQGHVLSLDFDPEELALADITQPGANLFAIGTYELVEDGGSAVPEPGAALLFSVGIAVVSAGWRRGTAASA